MHNLTSLLLHFETCFESISTKVEFLCCFFDLLDFGFCQALDGHEVPAGALEHTSNRCETVFLQFLDI